MNGALFIEKAEGLTGELLSYALNAFGDRNEAANALRRVLLKAWRKRRLIRPKNLRTLLMKGLKRELGVSAKQASASPCIDHAIEQEWIDDILFEVRACDVLRLSRFRHTNMAALFLCIAALSAALQLINP